MCSQPLLHFMASDEFLRIEGRRTLEKSECNKKMWKEVMLVDNIRRANSPMPFSHVLRRPWVSRGNVWMGAVYSKGVINCGVCMEDEKQKLHAILSLTSSYRSYNWRCNRLPRSYLSVYTDSLITSFAFKCWISFTYPLIVDQSSRSNVYLIPTWTNASFIILRN